MTVETLERIDCFAPLRDEAITLSAGMRIPHGARAVVVLCGDEHAGVADSLRHAGIATVSIDLLTAAEQRECGHASCLRANIPLLAHRLACATDWLATNDYTRDLPIGYFGTDVGSAIALAAAAQRPADVEAIVSYAGRPLLVLPVLAQVRTPTLLITPAADPAMVKLHHIAVAQLNCQHAVAIVTGTEEMLNYPVACAHVAHLAYDWFAKYLLRLP